MKNKRFTLSKRDLDFIDKTIEISDAPASIENATFMFLPFCQVGLPRSSQDDISFSRSCGAMQLKVSDGTNGTVSKIPFGPAARLILAYICSHAVRFKTSKIELGNSAAEFMRRIGLASTGGRKGSLTSVKLQLLNIHLCCIEVHYRSGKKIMDFEGPIFKDSLNVINFECGWRSHLHLNEEFYEILVQQKNCVPIYKRAVIALKRSALAMDIYFMLAERLHRARKTKSILYWKNLRDQFAHEYANNENGKRSFKRNFVAALRKVLMVYPSAKVKLIIGGIEIQKSPPPIPNKKLSTTQALVHKQSIE
jgi:hypothetical protein